MALLPVVDDFYVEEENKEKSRTYKIDLTNKRCVGTIEGESALKQRILKALNTARFRYKIYSGDYGSDMDSLLGQQPEYVKAKLPMLIKETVLADSEVISVENIEVKQEKHQSTVHFDMKTVFGNISMFVGVTV